MGGRIRKNRKNLSNPFSSLKGFCVSGAPDPPKPKQPPTDSPREDGPDLFAREMERLGVKGAGEPEAPSVPSEGSEEKTVSAGDDRGLFLQALGTMDTVFQDELPDLPEPVAAPRRMKLVRQGKLVPEAVLDLHGLNRLQAREKIGHFLDNALWQGYQAVLVVTGRGHGSEGEPVLRAEAERYLRQEAGHRVAEWGRAPARYGGDGALVVFLRSRKK